MIIYKELKNIISCRYNLTINTGCDFEKYSFKDLLTNNDLYNDFDNCIVESVDIYDDSANNEIILHALNYDDETGLYYDAVTCETLPDYLQKEVKTND